MGSSTSYLFLAKRLGFKRVVGIYVVDNRLQPPEL